MSGAPRFGSRLLLRGEQSGGAVSALENWAGAGWEGPPLHRHDFDEAFYVLEGELTFALDGDLITAGAGEFAFAPRGVAHTLANLSAEDARYLLVCTPAGFERTLERRRAQEAGVEPPAWALGELPEVEVLGPPIGRDPDEGPRR